VRGCGLIAALWLAWGAAPAAAQGPAKPEAKVVLHASEVPLYKVFAWERWGNFINAQAGSSTEIPYDAARLEVKVYPFPSGEIRAIRFPNGVRTHRHINQTDTILYSWQAHRVQFVDDKAVLAEPGDFALHQKGVYHSGEEIRRGGGIDLEFALPFAGIHNDPTGFWSLARDHPLQPAAAWIENGQYREAVGDAAASAPAGAVRYQVRAAVLPDYAAREVRLAKGATVAWRDATRDRLIFVLSGKIATTIAKYAQTLTPEDAASVPRGVPVTITATEDATWAEALVPPHANPR
jgi:quercetin dioxygenase-like cupin family protein